MKTNSRHRTWYDRLVTATRKGAFTRRDYGAANHFTSCAVGEHHRLRRDEKSHFWEPEDDAVNKAGMDFFFAVRNNNLPAAWRAYGEIQALFVETPEAFQ